MKPSLHKVTTLQLGGIARGSSGSYIFQGPAGSGKSAAAYWLALKLNCQTEPGDDCDSCRLLAAGNHPDYHLVQPLSGKSSIGIEQVHQLQRNLQLSRFGEGVRVVIIDRSDQLTDEAQNAMLKLLEEPPSNTAVILLSEHPESLLLTVRSRCQEIVFPGLAPTARGDVARQVLGARLFDRLLMVPKLTEETQLGSFVDQLGQQLQADLRQTASAGNQQLVQVVASQMQAVEKLRLRLGANVSVRLALEGLMLEL